MTHKSPLTISAECLRNWGKSLCSVQQTSTRQPPHTHLALCEDEFDQVPLSWHFSPLKSYLFLHHKSISFHPHSPLNLKSTFVRVVLLTQQGWSSPYSWRSSQVPHASNDFFNHPCECSAYLWQTPCARTGSILPQFHLCGYDKTSWEKSI